MSEFKPNKSNPEAQVITPEVETKLAVPADEKLLEAHNRNIQAESLEAAREAVHETAAELSTLEQTLQANEKAPDSLPDERSIRSKELKNITKDRELISIQRRLPKSQKTLSRVIHQPVVRYISEAASNTVSRPSGLLGGGLLALIGTTSYFLLAKHIGFTYNYTVFLALFVGGFVVGIALEFLVHLLTASKRNHSD